MFFRGFSAGIVIAVLAGCGAVYFILTNGMIPPNANAAVRMEQAPHAG
jgi:hypothetical protein